MKIAAGWVSGGEWGSLGNKEGAVQIVPVGNGKILNRGGGKRGEGSTMGRGV